MKITWYGQASFAMESEAGLRVVTDPYDPSTSGFKAFRTRPTSLSSRVPPTHSTAMIILSRRGPAQR